MYLTVNHVCNIQSIRLEYPKFSISLVIHEVTNILILQKKLKLQLFSIEKKLRG